MSWLQRLLAESSFIMSLLLLSQRVNNNADCFIYFINGQLFCSLTLPKTFVPIYRFLCFFTTRFEHETVSSKEPKINVDSKVFQQVEQVMTVGTFIADWKQQWYKIISSRSNKCFTIVKFVVGEKNVKMFEHVTWKQIYVALWDAYHRLLLN